MTYSDLKKVEIFARCNGSKNVEAHPRWTFWAEQWIAKGEISMVTSIDNYHHARRVIKSSSRRCTGAKASGNCVTIFFE